MSLLRQNSRLSLTRMSKKLNIPISTIYDKLKLHDGTIIKKNTCLVDFSKLGYNARANVTIRVERTDREPLLQYLLKIPNVNSVFKISNGYDYLLEVIFENVRDLEDFFEIVETKFKVKDRQVYFIIDDIKREAFLSDETLIPEIGT